MTLLGLRKKIAISFSVVVAAWLGGFVWFFQFIPTQQSRFSEESADAIVVLTGGSGRLDYGLELLAQNAAPRLFVSGAGEKVTVDDIIAKASAASRDVISPSTITLGHQAENTIGNAEETARWLEETNSQRILLVTANYHMPRALQEFSTTSPQLDIIPAPVIPSQFNLLTWWRQTDDRQLLLSEYHKYLASKLRHWFVSLTHKT